MNPGQADRYPRIRGASDALAARLSPEDCTPQSMPDASPVKWHLAHTSWFFETFVLEKAIPGYAAFDSAYRVLFNSYYNSVGEQYHRPERGLLTRPDLDEVRSLPAPRRLADRRRSSSAGELPATSSPASSRSACTTSSSTRS